MDYKNRYKVIREMAKHALDSDKKGLVATDRVLIKAMFPELAESKDERIRKAIAEMIHDTPNVECEENYNVCKEDILAWLEKQKEIDKEIVFRPLAGTDIRIAAKQALEKIEIGKEVVLAFNGAYIPVNGKTVAEICNEYFSWVEKQGEQKPAEKVEPKFHKGEWLCENEPNNYARFIQILEIVNVQGKERYRISRDLHNDEDVVECRFIENNYHSFNIQDAKDGDVLYSLDSKQPFIFKHRKPNEQAAVYCGINTYGKFFIGNTKDCVITTDKYIPADKFQRNLLFKKMQKAGYEWDMEKKELKLLISNGGDFESNNSKQKPTWSDEDEEILKNLIDYFSLDDGLRLPTEETIDWLKSLKKRMS